MASSERSLVVKPAGAHVFALRKKFDLHARAHGALVVDKLSTIRTLTL